jgi:hypothetical protein
LVASLTTNTAGADVAGALPELLPTSLEEVEEKIMFLQRQPIGLGWSEVTQLITKHTHIFAGFDQEAAAANASLIQSVLHMSAPIKELVAKAPGLLMCTVISFLGGLVQLPLRRLYVRSNRTPLGNPLFLLLVLP